MALQPINLRILKTAEGLEGEDKLEVEGGDKLEVQSHPHFLRWPQRRTTSQSAPGLCSGGWQGPCSHHRWPWHASPCSSSHHSEAQETLLMFLRSDDQNEGEALHFGG